MPSRRCVIKTVLVCAAAASLPRLAPAQQPPPTTGSANLKDTLLFGLRPRTPTEQAFIDTVVAKVNAGQLPLEMVIGTFRWARPKQPYPFPFFERALKDRAAKAGISL
jgi:hypothetical protein